MLKGEKRQKHKLKIMQSPRIIRQPKQKRSKINIQNTMQKQPKDQQKQAHQNRHVN